jgi:methionyl-tRNA formyltransferase
MGAHIRHGGVNVQTTAHLLATDPAGLRLFDLAPDIKLVGVIVPSNRVGSRKVEDVVASARRQGIPVGIHKRGGRIPSELPDAGLAISWMYSQIISSEDIDRYPAGVINMHGGRIPEYRGASVLQWAIINGESEISITWHEIVEAVDAGPIWAERELGIGGDKLASDIREEMINMGLQLFPAAWARKSGGAPPVRIPDLSNGRVWPQRGARDGALRPGLSPRQLRDFMRALCPPWPLPTWEGRSVVAIGDMQSSDSVEYRCSDGSCVYLKLSIAP